MARFLIRCEIEEATPVDYEMLCSRLHKRKIYRVISNLEGIYYDLPAGTFMSDYYSNHATFFEIARNTALAVTNQYEPAKRYEIIVFEYTGSMFVLNENTDKKRRPKP